MSTPIRISLSYAGPTPSNINEVANTISQQLGAGLSAAMNKNQALRTTLERVGAGNLTRLPAALSSVGSASQSSLFSIKGMVSALPSLASGLWLAEKAGRALSASLSFPADFTKRVLEATEVYRRFAVTISSTVGSFPKATDITDRLRRESRYTAMTGPELLAASQQAAFAPGMSGQFAVGSAAETSKRFADYGQLLQRASIFAPEQGTQGAGIALRELMSGQSQSIQRRLNINPESIADSIGKRLSEILASPKLAMAAVQRYTELYSGNDVLEGQKGLFSTATKKLADSFEQALASIGRSGTYDMITDRIRGVTDVLLDSFDESSNPRWKEQSRRITSSIGTTLDNITNSFGRFLQRVGDTTNPLDSVAEAVTRLWEAGAKASEMLPMLGKALGQAGGWILDTARQVAAVAQHGFAGSIRIAGFDVPVSVGDADRIQELRDQIDSAENRPGGAPGSPFRLRQMKRMEANKVELDRLLNGGAASSGNFASVASGFKDFSLADLARPYQTQRQIKDVLDQTYSGTNGRLIAQGIIDPVSRASGGFDYRSGYDRILDKVDAIPKQLKELLYAREIGYPGMLRSAENDLNIAKLARTAPAEVSLKSPALWSRLTAPVTRSAGDVMADAIGPARAETWFASQIEDKGNTLEAVRALPQRLVRELQAVAGAISSNLKDLPPNLAAKLGDSLIENVDGLADQISDQLHLPADLREKLRNAVKEGPAELVTLIQSNAFEARQRGIQLSLPQDLPATAQQLINGQFSTPREQQINLIELREMRQKQYAAQYDEITSKLAKDPRNRELQIDQGLTGAALRANQLQLLELKHGVDDLAKSMEQFGSATRDAMENGLSNSIENAIKGTGNLKDALLGFANDITHAFSQMASRNLLQAFIGDGLQAGAGPGGQGVGAIGGILGSLGTYFTSRFSGTTSPATAAPPANYNYGFSDSGVFANVRPLARGGIVRAGKPVVGLIGEGTSDELILPIPRTSSGRLPVELPAGKESPAPQVHIYNVSSEAEAFARGYRAGGKDIIMGDVNRGIEKGKIGRR